MARYINYNLNQTKLLPINFSEQILPGTFEHTLRYLIDEQLDLSVFEKHYKNDITGRLAYDPAILLKIILAAYAEGLLQAEKSNASAMKILFLWLYLPMHNRMTPHSLISSLTWPM